MVAHTLEYCLPYFEGSDSPCLNTGTVCEPSTVWCDMAARIDEVLTTFDTEISRAVTSFPYAQVAISQPFIFNSGASNLVTVLALWDTVVGDSDAMVDLNVDPSTVNLRRSGIWNLTCTVVWQSSINDTLLQIILNYPSDPTVISPTFPLVNEMWEEPVPDPGSIPGPVIGMSNIADWFYRVDASGGPVPLQIQLQAIAPVGDIDVTVAVCRFSARWVADLP